MSGRAGVIAVALVAVLGIAASLVAAESDGRSTAFSLDIPPADAVATLHQGQAVCQGPLTAVSSFGFVTPWITPVAATSAAKKGSTAGASDRPYGARRPDQRESGHRGHRRGLPWPTCAVGRTDSDNPARPARTRVPSQPRRWRRPATGRRAAEPGRRGRRRERNRLRRSGYRAALLTPPSAVAVVAGTHDLRASSVVSP